ncbi:MAG: phosphate acyltransferase PlsX [Clostridia bacterium]|nr:phosphate acyltransferase PlsX [Clostridia bacterium]
MNRYKIAIDVMGSDKGAPTLVEGAVKALMANEALDLVLVGDSAVIADALQKNNAPEGRVEIIHATDVITNYDSPVEAIFKKLDSSLVVALKTVAEREDIFGMICAGSTGALISGALRYLPAKPLKRPALAAILPAAAGGFVCLVDTGANIDCTPAQLVSFAKMGSDFMREYYAIESPRIGLLSNGAESTKGNKLVRETHALLAADDGLNFVGNIEGTNALSGDCDVLVADGFAGNQVLKNSEGIARRIITDIVRYAKKTGNNEIMKLVGYLMGIYDFNSLGGGILLGVGKPVIKAHGAANADSIMNTAKILINMSENRDIFNGRDERANAEQN